MDTVGQKTCVIYCRVSSAEQVQGTSLTMQERLCREYADREDLKILNVYIEEGESAKTTDRKEFQKALAFCGLKKQKVNYFIVHKIDRFARNQVDHFATQAVLKKYGTELRSVSEPISNDPVGKAMEGMLAVFAEFDNNVRSARSKSGMIEKVKRGEWVWYPPLGYKRLRKGGNLVVDDEVAPYIRLLFEEYSKGTHSYLSLAQFMQRQGMRTRTGRKPGMQIMEKILRNHLYYGVIKDHFEMTVRGTFPALIDEELFWRCQPGSRRNKFRSERRMRVNPDYPLRKMVICAVCQDSITGSASTGRKGKKYPYYHHHKKDCPVAKSIPKETFEQNFVEYLESISPSTEYEDVFKAIVSDVWQNNHKKLDQDHQKLERELSNLRDERQKIFDFHRIGKYSDQDFLDQKRLIDEKILEKELLRDEKRIEEFDMNEALDYCFRFVREASKTWVSLKKFPEFQARFQKQIFPEKIAFDGKKFGTTNLSLLYKLNQPDSAETSDLVTSPGIEPGFTP